MSKQIRLTKGKFATVDDSDYEILSKYRWQCAVRGKLFYATTDINKEKLYMHRMIMDAPPSVLVDHIDGDGLRNTRDNLRLATHQQNVAHRTIKDIKKHSIYHGVFLAVNKRSWFAQIVVSGKCIYLGIYRTQRDAAIAYNKASLEYNKEFATLNVIPDKLDPRDIPFPDPPISSNQYKGVKKQARGGWIARVSINSKEIHLGTYSTPEEAAKVRDQYIIDNKLNRPLNFS